MCPNQPKTCHSGLPAPLDFLLPNFNMSFFLGACKPAPPGAVVVGEGAALEAALWLIFDTPLSAVLIFVSVSGSRLMVAAGSVGPNDLKPPRLRACAWLGDAE